MMDMTGRPLPAWKVVAKFQELKETSKMLVIALGQQVSDPCHETNFIRITKKVNLEEESQIKNLEKELNGLK